MGKYFVVIAHPEPKSICHAAGSTAIDALLAAGHEVKTSHLYEANFDPVLSRTNYNTIKNPDHFSPRHEDMHATAMMNGFAEDVEAEMLKLEWCDALILQFPLYWLSFPAILKGWVDRVFAFRRIFSAEHRYTTGRFIGKRAILSITTGAPESNYTREGAGGDMMSGLRHIHRGILEFVGFSVLRPNILFAAPMPTDESRQAFLVAWAERVLSLHEEQPIDVGRFE